MTPLFTRMTVAGVGLIGGSLARAVRDAGLASEVVGFGRSEANLRVARERGLVDRTTSDPAVAAAGADVVILAVPAGSCAAVAEALRPHARPGTILTDAASVKVTVVAALEARWTTTGPVVGAHPIAGSEASGAEAARGDLFRGRRCIVTPTPTTDRTAVARVAKLWAGVGATVEEMTPAVHDEILARVSHLPHVLAYALVGAVGDMAIDGRRALDYAGSGFRDTTRIAASPVAVWRDILLANVTPVRAALAELRVELDELERLVATGDVDRLEAALARARDARRRLGTGDS